MGRQESKGQGFTLLDMLVALSVLLVMVLLAAPSALSWLQRRQLQDEAQALLGSLALARAQAVMHQQRVTLCPSHGGAACDNATQGAWQGGWIVFVDTNRNGLREPDEPLLQQRPASAQGVQIMGRSTLSQAIAYGADGGSEGLHGQFLAGTVLVCAPGQREGWQLVLNALGRARLERVDTPTCP